MAANSNIHRGVQTSEGKQRKICNKEKAALKDKRQKEREKTKGVQCMGRFLLPTPSPSPGGIRSRPLALICMPAPTCSDIPDICHQQCRCKKPGVKKM